MYTKQLNFQSPNLITLHQKELVNSKFNFQSPNPYTIEGSAKSFIISLSCSETST